MPTTWYDHWYFRWGWMIVVLVGSAFDAYIIGKTIAIYMALRAFLN